uniref:McrBC like restriction enzyme n=1 Tax=Achromobacter ruhlandii TaxID=72557 RepID=A0A482F2U9_9BURK|nr:McrBC like restriction enzyme [Achromobacter ruhlandii]
MSSSDWLRASNTQVTGDSSHRAHSLLFFLEAVCDAFLVKHLRGQLPDLSPQDPGPQTATCTPPRSGLVGSSPTCWSRTAIALGSCGTPSGSCSTP